MRPLYEIETQTVPASQTFYYGVYPNGWRCIIVRGIIKKIQMYGAKVLYEIDETWVEEERIYSNLEDADCCAGSLIEARQT